MFSITSSFQLLVVWREWRKFRLTASIVRRKGEVIGSRSNLDQGPLKIQDGECHKYTGLKQILLVFIVQKRICSILIILFFGINTGVHILLTSPWTMVECM